MKLFLAAACLAAFPVSVLAEVTVTEPFDRGSTLADKLDKGARFPLTLPLERSGAITVDVPVLRVAATRPEAAR